MDKAIFIKELKDLFTSLNKKENRYSEVWLSEIDFGGLYYSEKYILNVKMSFHIDARTPEIRFIDDFLEKNLDAEKYNLIECPSVYNDYERIWHERGDIILWGDVYLNAA